MFLWDRTEFGATKCDASTRWGVRSERFELSLAAT
jgi:hypothetical protein